MDKLKGYLVWLKWALAFGANLKPVFDLIVEFYGRLKPLLPALPIPELPGDDGGLAITQQLDSGSEIGTTLAMTEGGEEIVADVLEAESKVCNLIAEPNQVVDGSRLRAIYQMWLVIQALLTAFKTFSG